MWRGILALCVLGFGCSGSSDGEGDDTFTCDPRREGTYLVDLTTVDGSCGDQNSFVDRLDNDAPIPAGCQKLEADTWSADGCKLERSMRCPLDGLAPGATIESTAVTTQKREDLITGLMTMLIYDADGALVCSGTYNLSATRQ
jgi:hypothetical protein